jgi:hypothetical protein
VEISSFLHNIILNNLALIEKTSTICYMFFIQFYLNYIRKIVKNHLNKITPLHTNKYIFKKFKF